MCRLAWQLLGMLGNVLGRPRHALQRPRHACNVLGMFQKAWWYTTLLASQLIRQQVRGLFFDVGLLWPCKKHAKDAEDVASMPRTLPSIPRTLSSMPMSCQASLHILGSHKRNRTSTPHSKISTLCMGSINCSMICI